jgi:GTP-binding protein HflX
MIEQSIDRPKGGERAVLVHIHFPAGQMQEDLLEFKELALSAGAEMIALVTGTRSTPSAKYFVGGGKAEEIRAIVAREKADLVIFNHTLTPAQERNLERLLQCRVIDRTGLILDIFAQRARSFEGKLQVELALLKHLSTRLVRGWTHLERQRGGIGLRGPGETQLETDRRLIRGRIKFITQRLNRVRKQREQGRHARRKAIVPTVALVGYTNAGKSTLFNRLTGADAYVADRLFATLDPTLRRIELPEIGPLILADTVGFIRHLPHDLVEAFYATLEEICEADLLLHVVDAEDSRKDLNIKQVEEVLTSIGAEDVPILLVFNKIDLNSKRAPGVDRHGNVFVSAVSGAGLDALQNRIVDLAGQNIVERSLSLKPKDSRLRAIFYQLGAVMSEKTLDDGSSELVIRMPKAKLNKLI